MYIYIYIYICIYIHIYICIYICTYTLFVNDACIACHTVFTIIAWDVTTPSIHQKL